MPPFPGLTASSGPISRATKTSVSTQTIATIVFGICAVMGTIFTVWQGHKSLKMRSQKKSVPSAVRSDIELHEHNEVGPQRSHPTAFPRLPEAPKKTFDVTITSIPPKEVFESPGPRSTPILVPPGVKTKTDRIPDTRRAAPHCGTINRALT